MNKVSILVLTLALSACTSTPDTNWTNDCAKHHSYDSREFALCKKRMEAHKADQAAGTVALDKDSINVPTEEDMKKTKSN